MTKTSEKTLRSVCVGGGIILFEVQKPSEINRKKFKNWRYKGKKLGDFRFTVHTQRVWPKYKAISVNLKQTLGFQLLSAGKDRLESFPLHLWTHQPTLLQL